MTSGSHRVYGRRTHALAVPGSPGNRGVLTIRAKSSEASTLISPIANAHHHLWDVKDYHVWLHANARVVNFVGDYESICQNYLARDFLADSAGLPVIASVHIQAEFDSSNPVGETAW